MTQRASRFLLTPTKALRFLWTGQWVQHRRPTTPGCPAYRRFAAAVCAAPFGPAVSAPTPNAPHTTPNPLFAANPSLTKDNL